MKSTQNRKQLLWRIKYRSVAVAFDILRCCLWQCCGPATIPPTEDQVTDTSEALLLQAAWGSVAAGVPSPKGSFCEELVWAPGTWEVEEACLLGQPSCVHHLYRRAVIGGAESWHPLCALHQPESKRQPLSHSNISLLQPNTQTLKNSPSFEMLQCLLSLHS